MAITIIEEDEIQISKDLEPYYPEIEGIVRWNWTVNQTARQQQLNDIEIIRKLCYSSSPSAIKYGEDYTLPDLPRAQNVLLTQLDSMYTSNQGLFDCVGSDTKSLDNAPKQKASIVSDLDMMNFRSIWERANEDYSVSGEYCFYVTYEEKKKKRKARISDLQPIIDGEAEDPKITKLKKQFPTITKMIVGDKEIEGYLVKATGDIITSDNIIRKTKTHVYYTITAYQGTKVIHIKSEDFCYDVQKENRIEDAYKIWRTYLTPEEILTNKDYDFDDDQKRFIKSLIKGFEPTLQTTTSQQLIWEKYVIYAPDEIGNQIQVFNYYGDIVLADGTVLNNYIITCCLGKVIRCEPDPSYVDPFVFYAPVIEPNYRRGIPLLRLAIIYNAIRSNISNVATDMLALVMNKPMFAEKGMFTAQIVKYEPGGLIEFNPGESSKEPQFIEFDSGLKAAMDVMEFFQETIEDCTGLTNTLSGTGDNKERTATEMNYEQAGATGRIGYTCDKIKRGAILPLIEKIADIKAVHEFDDINLNVLDESGKPKDVIIDSLVRNGNYKYVYHDNKTTAEIKQKFQEFMQFTQQFIPTGIVNEAPIFKQGLTMLGMDNPDQYINQNPVDQVTSQATKNMQPAQQLQAKTQLNGVAAQLLQQHLQQQQQQQAQGQQQQQGGMNASGQ